MGWLKMVFGKGTALAPEPAPAPASARPDLLIHHGAFDVEEWKYCATMQLRTPFRVLQRHGDVHSGPATVCPEISDVRWHGIWSPHVSDPRFDMLDEGSTTASDIGYIPADGGDYLPFLLAFRAIVEPADGCVETKECQIRDLLAGSGPGGTPYREFYEPETLIRQTFVSALSRLPSSSKVVDALQRSGLDTLGKVEHASDDVLLALPGLGPKSLTGIRSWLAAHPGEDRDVTRVLRPDLAE